MARSWQVGGVTSRRPGVLRPRGALAGGRGSPGAPAGSRPPLWAELVSWDPAGRGGRRTGAQAPLRRGLGAWVDAQVGAGGLDSGVYASPTSGRRGPGDFFFFFFDVQFSTSCVPVSGGGGVAV